MSADPHGHQVGAREKGRAIAMRAHGFLYMSYKTRCSLPTEINDSYLLLCAYTLDPPTAVDRS